MNQIGEEKKKSPEDIQTTLDALLMFAGLPSGSWGKIMDRAMERAGEEANPNETTMRNVTPHPDQIEAPKE